MTTFKKVKKSKWSDPLSDIDTLSSLVRRASHRAILNEKQAGVASVFIRDGIMFKRNPDDSIVEVKRGEPAPRLSIEDLFCQA